MKRLLLLLPSLLLASCAPSGNTKPTIVASFYPISFLASSIVGDKYDVVCLTPSGAEPHDFELTPKNVATLYDSKAIFINGLGMESWADSLQENPKEKTVTLSDGLPTKTIESRIDPHVWLDTRLYEKMAENMVASLAKLDPSNAQFYRDNCASFSKKMADLREYCHKIADAFEDKVIAVNHAAYGYMCDEYGIEQLYINSISPDEEPTQKAIEDILKAVEERGIDTIFFEELASDAVALKIAKETGAKTESLNPLEGLTQKEESEGMDYFSIYRQNMDKIARSKP